MDEAREDNEIMRRPKAINDASCWKG